MAAEHPYKLLLAETKKANQRKRAPEEPDPAAPADAEGPPAPPKKTRAKAKAKAAAWTWCEATGFGLQHVRLHSWYVMHLPAWNSGRVQCTKGRVLKGHPKTS